jgi:hypothetical protein
MDSPIEAVEVPPHGAVGPIRQRVLTWLAGSEAKAFVRRILRRDNVGIETDEVVNRAILAVLDLVEDPQIETVESYGRSRLEFAYRNLLRLELRHYTRAKAAPDGWDDDDNEATESDRFVVDGVELAVTSVSLDRVRSYLQASLAASHGTARPLRQVSVTAAAFNVVNISSNGGALPKGLPQKSTKLESQELELMAAAWLANPRLRVTDAPDDPAVRQARRRFLKPVREELAKAAAYAGLTRTFDDD